MLRFWLVFSWVEGRKVQRFPEAFRDEECPERTDVLVIVECAWNFTEVCGIDPMHACAAEQGAKVGLKRL